MNKVILCFALAFMLSACEPMKMSARSYENCQNTLWVYIEIQSNGNESDYRYFLFGEMKESLLNDISNNVIESGFFMLSSVKYYDNNNLVANYADDEYTGNMVFRIEDIQMIKKMKKAPQIGLKPIMGTDELNLND